MSALVGEIDAKSSSIVIHNISIEEGRNLLLDPIRETIAATTPTAIVLRSSVERRHDNIAHIMSELNIIPAREFDINFESTNSIQWGAKRYLNAIWSRRHVIRREPSIVFTYAKELLARKLKRFKQ